MRICIINVREKLRKIPVILGLATNGELVIYRMGGGPLKIHLWGMSPPRIFAEVGLPDLHSFPSCT